MTSLEGWGSTIELHPRVVRGVGATGLEPAIFCSQSRRASHYATPRATRRAGVRGSSVRASRACHQPGNRYVRTPVGRAYARP